MSWDIFIQDLPDVPTVADIPVDFRPGPIGRFDERLRQVLEAVPQAEQQDDDWLFVEAPDMELSISLTREVGTDDLRGITVFVHGGAASPQCVAAIVKRLGLRALDTSTGEFFDTDAPERGYNAWLAYRGQVTGEGEGA